MALAAARLGPSLRIFLGFVLGLHALALWASIVLAGKMSRIPGKHRDGPVIARAVSNLAQAYIIHKRCPSWAPCISYPSWHACSQCPCWCPSAFCSPSCRTIYECYVAQVVRRLFCTTSRVVTLRLRTSRPRAQRDDAHRRTSRGILPMATAPLLSTTRDLCCMLSIVMHGLGGAVAPAWALVARARARVRAVFLAPP